MNDRKLADYFRRTIAELKDTRERLPAGQRRNITITIETYEARLAQLEASIK